MICQGRLFHGLSCDEKSAFFEMMDKRRKDMKQLLIASLLLLALSGCREEKITEETKSDARPLPETELLQKLPDHPSEEDEIFNNDNAETSNEELWEMFKEEVGEGKEAELIIARYTIEGEVIYELLRYDGEGYTLYYDTSRDSYAGSQPDPVSRTYICELDYITMEEVNNEEKPFRNHYAFLTNDFYQSEEDLMEAFMKLREGQGIDLVDVFSDVRLYQ